MSQQQLRKYLKTNKLDLSMQQCTRIALVDPTGWYYSLSSTIVNQMCKILGIELGFDGSPCKTLSIEGDTIWYGLQKIREHGGIDITKMCLQIKARYWAEDKLQAIFAYAFPPPMQMDIEWGSEPLERTPQIGQVWQHYEGRNYKILFLTGVPEPYPNDIFPWKWGSIKSTETQKALEIIHSRNSRVTWLIESSVWSIRRANPLPDEYIKEPHVLYQCDGLEKAQVWARPLNMFLNEFKSGGKSFYRFVRVS